MLLGQSNEDEGSLMKFFEYLGRPAEAAFTGVKYALDPERSGLEGLWRGLMGEEKTEMSDILGYDPNTPGGWTADFASKLVLDPLNLIPITKAGTGLKYLTGAANDALMASRVGRHVGGKLSPYGAYAQAEPAMMGAMAQAKPYAIASEKIMSEADPILQEAAQRTGMSLDEMLWGARKAYETGQETYSEAPELFNLIGRMREQGEGAFELGQQGYRRLGMEVPAKIEDLINPVTGEVEQRFMSRQLSPEGKELVTSGEEGPKLWQRPTGVAESAEIDTRSVKHRQIMRFVDYDDYQAYGNLTDPAVALGKSDIEKPLFTKMNNAGLSQAGITRKQVGDETQYWMGDRRVQPIHTSLADLVENNIIPKELFTAHPLVSEFKHTLGNVNRATFVNWLADLREEGMLHSLPAAEGALFDTPQGMARLGIPGFEHLAAPQAVTNRIQNVARVMFDPEDALGQMDGAFQHLMNNTKFGQVLKDYTGWWTRNTLALFPAFHLGNSISNLFLMYTAGTNPITGIKDGYNILKQAGDIGGIPAEKLYEALKVRGGLEASWSRDILRDIEEGAGAIKSPYVHKMAEALPEPLQSTGRTVEKVADKWGDANRWGLQFGQRIEDTARAGVFADFVKKAVRSNPNLMADEVAMAKMLDEGVVHARSALVDYGELSSLARSMKSAVPFISWYRGIVGRTLEDLGVAPQRLARVGHVLDFTFDPMSQYQANIAPEYVKDQAPIMGLNLFGQHIPIPSEAGQGMALMGRFIPQQFLEGLFRRPLATLAGAGNPALKLPFEPLSNFDLNKMQPIDVAARGPGEALTGPITGEPHTFSSNRVAGIPLPSAYQHILAALPGYRYATNYADPIARMIGTEADIPTLADPGRLPTSIPEQLGQMLTGARVYPFDEAKYTKQTLAKRERTVNELKRDAKYWLQRGDEAKATASLQMLNQLLETTSPLGD